MSKKELKWIIIDKFGEEKPVCLTVRLDGFNYEAYIKWDGCVDFTKKDACMGSDGMEDEDIHICDIPAFITILQSLEDFRMNNIESAE